MRHKDIIFIKIVDYTSLGNGWIAILILSGMLETCINSRKVRQKVKHKAESKLQEFFKEVSCLPINPLNTRHLSTLNDLQYTVIVIVIILILTIRNYNFNASKK